MLDRHRIAQGWNMPCATDDGDLPVRLAERLTDFEAHMRLALCFALGQRCLGFERLAHGAHRVGNGHKDVGLADRLFDETIPPAFTVAFACGVGEDRQRVAMEGRRRIVRGFIDSAEAVTDRQIYEADRTFAAQRPADTLPFRRELCERIEDRLCRLSRIVNEDGDWRPHSGLGGVIDDVIGINGTFDQHNSRINVIERRGYARGGARPMMADAEKVKPLDVHITSRIAL